MVSNNQGVKTIWFYPLLKATILVRLHLTGYVLLSTIPVTLGPRLLPGPAIPVHRYKQILISEKETGI